MCVRLRVQVPVRVRVRVRVQVRAGLAVCVCVCVSACVCMSARVLVFVSAFVWSACPPSIFNSPAERTLTMALSRIRRSWAIFWCIKYAE